MNEGVMLPRDHQRKLRKLRIFSKRLDRMIENGSFYSLPFWRRYALVRRVQRLYGSLLGPLSPAAARAILAGAATIALAACTPAGSDNPPPKADHPSFAAAAMNPFGFVPIVSAQPVAPAFADIDGDGDADLFAGAGAEGNGVIRYYANSGSKTSPSFAAAADYPGLPESTTPTYTNLSPVPVLAPFRGGPLWDALIGHGPGGAPGLEYYQNDGSSFSSSTMPANLPTSAGYALTSTVVDINGDGLLDVFVSTSDGSTDTIDYFKNTGTASAPVFSDQSTSLGLDIPVGAYGYPTFVGIDADGLFDAFIGNENGDIYFFKNIGTATVPQFAAPVKNPFGISPVPVGPAVPAFVDIDHDGDFDLFVGDGNGDLWFYKNSNF
jgi:hypothetical protein